MLRIENLKLSPGGGPSALRNAVLHILRIPEKDLLALHILRRSIDAREGVRMVYTVEVEAADEAAVLRRCRDKHVSKAAPRPVYQLPEPVTPPEVPPVVVGAGPAGLFAALVLARAGARPILLVLVVVIAGYALTLRHEDASGQMRTGMEGLRYYLTPHMEGLTISRFLQILLDAMSQLFFSLSVSMGIMITYGSYVKPEVNLNKAVNQIEIFDTGVALLAGAMIIPAVYVFSGTEGMSAGPSLMFVSLPKVFAAMGKAGTFVGILFFVTAIFATLTSCISVLESITANCMEIFHTSRKKTVLVLTVIYLAASAIIALGYSIFYFEVQLPNGSAAQLLDIMDYVSNSVMMPFIALLSTILIGWVMTPDYVIDEMQRGGKTFRRKKLYRVMIRYVAPVMMLVLFLQSTGILA